jgi:hypothetical protein
MEPSTVAIGVLSGILACLMIILIMQSDKIYDLNWRLQVKSDAYSRSVQECSRHIARADEAEEKLRRVKVVLSGEEE